MAIARAGLIATVGWLFLTAPAGAQGSQVPPPFPAGKNWTVDRSQTIPYPAWLNAGPEISDDLKSILASEKGNLEYWIKVSPGAQGQVVVAVGEAHWTKPGQRLMDILVDGQARQRGVDPIVVAGGTHRLGAILCEAEDLDRDGRLHIQVRAAPGAPDHVTLLAGLWWFDKGGLTREQALQLVKTNAPLKADLFIPAIPATEVRAILDAKNKASQAEAERQRQSKARVSEGLAKLPNAIHTDDPVHNTIAEKIFSQCVFSKLYDPIPPALPHQWFSPGGGYVGQWVWDTMFVLAAYAPMGEDEIIRHVFDNYWQTMERNPEAPPGSYRYGMVPNFLKDWPPLGYSQIPILAWGARQVYHQTHDRKLLEQCLPYLLAFDQWYATERDVDGDGLIEFGAYKPIGGTDMIQTARFESFDLHPPMDDMKLTPHPSRPNGGAWYGNVEGVEQTCFLLMSEQALAEIARELGNDSLARKFDATVARRTQAIQAKMWDPEKKFFYSLDRDSDRRIPVRTIQGFLTMACGVATPEQAELLVRQLQDPKQWWTQYPVPTVALDDPKFDPKGFWRGDMWPVTTYLVAYGLNRYGYHELARRLTDRIVEQTLKYGVNERYNAVTGEPIGVAGLGMSCAIWSMIVENRYGVGDDFRTIRVPPQAQGRELRLGLLEVRYPTEEAVALRSAFPRRFEVVYPQAPTPLRVAITCNSELLPAEQIVVSSNRASFNARPGNTYLVTRAP